MGVSMGGPHPGRFPPGSPRSGPYDVVPQRSTQEVDDVSEDLVAVGLVEDFMPGTKILLLVEM